jgi:hypothetical protein
MSELITSRPRIDMRLQLLATVSALALLAVATTQAKAEDADRPTVWIEAGWQFEGVTGRNDMLVPPLDGLTTTGFSNVPTAANFLGQGAGGFPSFTEMENALGHSSGVEASISFQPKGSDWVFGISARYGRVHGRRHVQSRADISGEPAYVNPGGGPLYLQTPHYTNYVEQASNNTEAHTIVDFTVGRDVGLGLFGERTESTFNLGARYVQMNMTSKGHSYAQPAVRFYHLKSSYFGKYYIQPRHQNSATLLQRYSDFHALGPMLSWSNTTRLWGKPTEGEVALDWGMNAAILFGRQKAKVDYSTAARNFRTVGTTAARLVSSTGTAVHRTQFHRVTVPNLGGFAGLSYRFTNAKISAGYRADFFFGAMDRGLDTHHSVTTGYQGPFATISIGFP